MANISGVLRRKILRNINKLEDEIRVMEFRKLNDKEEMRFQMTRNKIAALRGLLDEDT